MSNVKYDGLIVRYDDEKLLFFSIPLELILNQQIFFETHDDYDGVQLLLTIYDEIHDDYDVLKLLFSNFDETHDGYDEQQELLFIFHEIYDGYDDVQLILFIFDVIFHEDVQTNVLLISMLN